jgi:hypothetical protein
MTQPVRGTQKLVDQMGWVFKRPLLVLLEIGWRWLVGVPVLYVCWQQGKAILTALPPESTGLLTINSNNPWTAAVQIAEVWSTYAPHVAAVVVWLAPAVALAWAIVSGFGRSLVLAKLEPGLRFRPFAMITLQAGWIGLFAALAYAWFRSIEWVAATHIAAGGEADLVGYFIWAIFLSLGFFSLWALVSWPFAVAPPLMVLEGRSAISSFVESFQLGRVFTSKLMEINLVMGIVKLALIVLAMVFAAAPLPFADELGPRASQIAGTAAIAFYFVASDYFHVVKLKGIVEFWHVFRAERQTPRA